MPQPVSVRPPRVALALLLGLGLAAPALAAPTSWVDRYYGRNAYLTAYDVSGHGFNSTSVLLGSDTPERWDGHIGDSGAGWSADTRASLVTAPGTATSVLAATGTAPGGASGHAAADVRDQLLFDVPGLIGEARAVVGVRLRVYTDPTVGAGALRDSAGASVTFSWRANNDFRFYSGEDVSCDAAGVCGRVHNIVDGDNRRYADSDLYTFYMPLYSGARTAELGLSATTIGSMVEGGNALSQSRIEWGGITGVYMNGAEVAGWSVSSLSGVDYARSYITAVPEPAASAAFGGGLLLALGMIRRKRHPATRASAPDATRQ
ncbi:PEP-CTERM sorting domain-containing protein [Derxia lacustris]|uniref:PEP-CTERM sorting domain-containing protein n=1 Tax=Derxia lacustris TaxID=764842 RepID=UPI000A16DB1B|nr:PEP-CTERM sorting domain-containing protein [Derxia lacustris]